MNTAAVARVQQLCVLVENRPGALAEIVLSLGQRGINILAINLAEGLDHGYVRLVVDRPDDALRILSTTTHLVFTRDALAIPLEHRPGALGEVLELWGRSGVNVDYAYVGLTADCRPLLIAHVDQPDRAQELLS
jgi:hypothetical protein